VRLKQCDWFSDICVDAWLFPSKVTWTNHKWNMNHIWFIYDKNPIMKILKPRCLRTLSLSAFNIGTTRGSMSTKTLGTTLKWHWFPSWNQLFVRLKKTYKRRLLVCIQHRRKYIVMLSIGVWRTISQSLILTYVEIELVRWTSSLWRPSCTLLSIHRERRFY